MLVSIFMVSLAALSGAGCDDGGPSTGGEGGSSASAGPSSSNAIGVTSTGGPGGAGGAGGSGGGAAEGSASSAGGVGSGASGSSTSGAGGAGGGGAVGSPCMGPDGCDPGLYCQAKECGAGACAIKPPPGIQPQTKAEICGCDGVTYWNADIAAASGASVRQAGVCPDKLAVHCDAATPCAPGLRCNRKVEAAAACLPSATGACWGVPISCALEGPRAKGCTNQACVLECSLVQSQNPWFNDGACP
jgi:hypothetical protein